MYYEKYHKYHITKWVLYMGLKKKIKKKKRKRNYQTSTHSAGHYLVIIKAYQIRIPVQMGKTRLHKQVGQ